MATLNNETTADLLFNCSSRFQRTQLEFLQCYFVTDWLARFVYILITPIAVIGFIFCLILLTLLCVRRKVYPLATHDIPVMFIKMTFACGIYLRTILFPILYIFPETNPYAIFIEVVNSYCLSFYVLPTAIKFYNLSCVFIKYRLKAKYDMLQMKGVGDNEKQQIHLLNQIRFIDVVMKRIVLLSMVLLIYLVHTLIVIALTVFAILNIAAFNLSNTTAVFRSFNILYGTELALIITVAAAMILLALIIRVKEPFGILSISLCSLVALVLFLSCFVLFVICAFAGTLVAGGVSYAWLGVAMIVGAVEVFISVGIPILQTFWWKRRHAKDDRQFSSNEKLDSLKGQMNHCLQDKDLFALFYNFAQKEWSAENLMFWKEVHPYLSGVQKVEEEELKIVFQNLFHKFFDTNAPFALNLDSELQKTCKMALQDSSKMIDCLHLVKKKVEYVMHDTFHRFIQTEKYKQLIVIKQAALEISKDLNWIPEAESSTPIDASTSLEVAENIQL